ncbi:MAG: hypothetical protein HOQ22_00005, partial [Nocardioidaceae bacterium]|nr:hypothetical protein [Nocardioidaceae bacterium]
MAPRPDDSDDGVQPTGADDQPVGPDAADGPGEAAADHVAPPERTDDEVWAAIVAELGELDGLDGTEQPAEPESVPPAGTGAEPASGLTFPVAPWVADRRVVRPASSPTEPELSGRDWDGTAQIDDAEASLDAEEHFVPPDPGPVLGGDPLLTMAWCAAAGVPVFLLIVLVAWRDAPPALVQAAAALFVVGVGVLLWRMPH